MCAIDDHIDQFLKSRTKINNEPKYIYMEGRKSPVPFYYMLVDIIRFINKYLWWVNLIKFLLIYLIFRTY